MALSFETSLHQGIQELFISTSSSHAPKMTASPRFQMMKTLMLLAFLFAACPIVSEAESDRLPNIVFFFADDMGYADLGCYGHPYAVTPALDKLASEGTRFSQHYATGVTCNPSRTGLMTGLFPARYPKKNGRLWVRRTGDYYRASEATWL